MCWSRLRTKHRLGNVGHAALEELYADLRVRQGAEMPVEILTVRPATPDEVEFWRWARKRSPAKG